MNLAMWLLITAWSLLAAATSIPWFTHVGMQVFTWIRHPGLQVIIGLHLAGALCPIIAGVTQWWGKRLIACLSLTLLATVWLFWHILTFTQLAPVVRDLPRLLLSVVTLVFAVAYALRQARNPVGDAA